jgi:hypothetical protein
MAQYATAAELASYLEQDVDTSSANQALTIASDVFCDEAGTRFESNNATFTVQAQGRWYVVLPLGPVISVTSVTVNGVAVTDYTVIGDRLFRRGGFGVWGVFPPDRLDVTYTYGYTAVPDRVKGAVLEIAKSIYVNPSAAASEQIDDYRIQFGSKPAGIALPDGAASVAKSFRDLAPPVA